jgi:hypothetical protein
VEASRDLLAQQEITKEKKLMEKKLPARLKDLSIFRPLTSFGLII